MEIQSVIDYLKGYNGRPVSLMEVCGTHTAAIFKGGIRSFLSPKIRLISGPGCPVCVTPTAFIDRCVEYAMRPDCVLLSFGDMLKVPGTKYSLTEAKGEGARVELMYSPLEALDKAAAHPEITYVIAAVGFETTAPVYALLIDEARKRGIGNLRLVTALKTVIPALTWLCEGEEVDGFLCPGHVSVIIGSRPYEELAERYRKPFAVAGFEPEHILAAVYDLVRQLEEGTHAVHNYYPNAVKEHGNRKALAVLGSCFETGTAVWRGLGEIQGSGLYLKGEYAEYDGGSRNLTQDMKLPSGCRCGDVITGRINPDQCPMFAAGEKDGHAGCTPMSPYGPCMVSSEGACGIWYRNRV